MVVYEPCDDSELLASTFLQNMSGSVLDVGTGTGFLALQALPYATLVHAVDINPHAVRTASAAGVHAWESDLFSAVTQKYDTIVCNTPYLPNDPLVSDTALDGGPKGFEWTLRFLSEAKSFLQPHGRILFLISTLTNVHVVEEALIRLGYSFSVLARKKLSFEELIVYKATHALPEYSDAVFLAKGHRSKVYRLSDVVIKVSSVVSAQHEASILSRVNAHGLGPRLVRQYDDRVVMEYVEGALFEDVLQSGSSAYRHDVLRDVFTQATLLDSLGINKSEFLRLHKHALIRDNSVVLLDWERARFSPRPQNVAQFIECMRRLVRRGVLSSDDFFTR